MQVIAEHPDLELILLDLNPSDRDGFSLHADRVGERYPAISVLVLSAQQDRGSVVRALDLSETAAERTPQNSGLSGKPSEMPFS